MAYPCFSSIILPFTSLVFSFFYCILRKWFQFSATLKSNFYLPMIIHILLLLDIISALPDIYLGTHLCTLEAAYYEYLWLHSWPSCAAKWKFQEVNILRSHIQQWQMESWWVSAQGSLLLGGKTLRYGPHCWAEFSSSPWWKPL